jgi:GntR family phosphonate transport system transcriptional regulator
MRLLRFHDKGIGMGYRWQQISQTISHSIASGEYRRGGRLPTEAEFAERFGVNRHTVRRALKELRDQGILQSRQGAGVFVVGQARAYRLGKRTRLSQNLDRQGQGLTMTLLAVEKRRASDSERVQFGSHAGRGLTVTAVHGIRLLEGQPVSLFHSLVPIDLAPDFGEELKGCRSVTKALEACGIADYTRRSTHLTAVAADPIQAHHLECRGGDPLLRSDSVNILADGSVIEVGTTWFRGDSIRLVVD